MAPLSEEESKAMRSVLVLVFFVVVALKIPGLKTNMYRKQNNFCASVFRILTPKKARNDIKKGGVANSSLKNVQLCSFANQGGEELI